MNTIHQTLKERFGFDSFREKQQDIINDILLGKNVIGILPTGAGKSLCYQLPSFHMKGTIVVVSPLISLMQDQVESSERAKIVTATYNSSCDPEDRAEFFKKFSESYYDLIFVSPELVTTKPFVDALEKAVVALWVLDEAHCIYQWGSEFRPAYLKAAHNIKNSSMRHGARIAAFTASATPKTLRAIRDILNIPEAELHTTTFYRSNLCIQVVDKQADATQQTVQRLIESPDEGDGIVYCTTRAEVESLARHMQAAGLLALPYHAGLPSGVRIFNQVDFLKGETRIIVATIAFGMGIDKPDVRWVIHQNMPKNLEGYYQEIGRSGRDGKRSACIFLYDMGDITPLRKMIIKSVKDVGYREDSIADLSNVARFAESDKCRWKMICSYFGEDVDECGNCDNCLKKAEGE